MGLGTDDIEEILEDHSIELTTEELKQLKMNIKKNCLIKLKTNKRTKKILLTSTDRSVCNF